jgi:hypothetical protein
MAAASCANRTAMALARERTREAFRSVAPVAALPGVIST